MYIKFIMSFCKEVAGLCFSVDMMVRLISIASGRNTGTALEIFTQNSGWETITFMTSRTRENIPFALTLRTGMASTNTHCTKTSGKHTKCSSSEALSQKHLPQAIQIKSCLSCRIENEENHYRLHVSGFSGTVEDSFGWYHDKQSFSTPDTGDICAEISHGGWWFKQCFFANLNGVYYKVGYQ